MKNKIIAFLLAVITVATSFALVVPVAAAEEGEGEESLYLEATESALNNKYTDVQTKLDAEMANGYAKLYAQNANYELYANQYTGEVYLKDSRTGKFLTSNPISYGANSVATAKYEQLSQIWISFTELATSAEKSYNSFEWAAKKGQIQIEEITDGIKVEYALGDTVIRYAVPEAIIGTDFLNDFIYPFQDKILGVYEHLEELAPTIVAGMKNHDLSVLSYNGARDDLAAFRAYLVNTQLEKKAITPLEDSYKILYNAAKADPASDAYQTLLAELKALGAVGDTVTVLPTDKQFNRWVDYIHVDYMTLVTAYNGMIDPRDPAYAKEVAALRDKYTKIDEVDDVIYYLKDDASANKKRSLESLLAGIKPGYNVDAMLVHEAKVGIEYVQEVQPVFYCTLEYTLDDTGLVYNMPADSVTYDESKYTLTAFSILRYFGANTINTDKSTDKGYVFYPDGSGALFFDRDIKTSTSVTRKVYGYDYAYRTIVGENTQPVRLPVYGSVDTDANGISSGYLAVITEGDALVELTVRSISANMYLVAYQNYDLRPHDTYTTADITTEIPIYSDIWYTGNYKTKIYMLTDPALASTVTAEGYSYYRADYVGMANAYRHYLVDVAKTLSALDASKLETRLPLYIETFGFLETQKKILTFPVEVDVALTTFKDIIHMYKGDKSLSPEEEPELYYGLIDSDITNVKFRLSGYINGGYEGYYPQRLKINKSVGGKDGYKELLKYAKQQAENGMEVFLSVDLMYNYEPGKFGTPSQKKTLARSMDNRYASRQVYSAVYQDFFSHYSMVVSANKLESLFKKFDKKLSKFGADAIALDYMAEDLSSNFNEDNAFDRESAKNSVLGALKTIKSKYTSIMSTGGNAYALQYVDYLLDAPVDSSRYIYASRTVPFYGMVMHGYAQYAGGAFNETGSPDYELLRAIESGASMYYILSYRNTNLIKEDASLNQHYSANYKIWKDDLVEYYNTLDYAIGDLQTWKIVDHRFLAVERIVSTAESAADLATLEAEYLSFVRQLVNDRLDAKGAYIRRLGTAGVALAQPGADKAAIYEALASDVAALDEEAKTLIEAKMAADTALTAGAALEALVSEGEVSLAYGQNNVRITFDKAALLADAALCFDRAVSADFEEQLDALIAELQTASGNIAISISAVEDYDSKTAYSFFTVSSGDDASYEATDYTLNDGSVVLVTYGNGTSTVSLILNFSVFDVRVKYNGVYHDLTKYDFVRLDARADGATDPRKGE